MEFLQEIKLNIAVVMAVYNGATWLPIQIYSIVKQEGVNVTIFISLDPSTDESRALCNQFASQFTNIIFLPSADKFGSASRNFFRLIRDVDLSNFDYVSFADQDDIWHTHKLVNSVNKLAATKYEGYSSNVNAFWLNNKTKLIDKAQPQREFDYMFESAGPGCTFVLTRKLALHLQTFLIQNQQACKNVALHDWFIYAFARTNNYKWVIDAQPHMQYRQHETNVVGANVGLQAKLNRWNKLRAGWLNTQAILLAEIIGYSDSWIIKRLKRNNLIDKLILIINVSKLRRKPFDRLALALSFLVGTKK